MKWRTKKKRIRQKVERIADKIPKAFKSKADREEWVRYVVNHHPDVNREEKNGSIRRHRCSD